MPLRGQISRGRVKDKTYMSKPIAEVKKEKTTTDTRLVIPLKKLSRGDVNLVGGKSSSLGEMISQLSSSGVAVPGGFSTTAHAYYLFLVDNNLPNRINDLLKKTNVSKTKELAKAGAQIRSWIMNAKFSTDFEEAIDRAVKDLIKSGVKSVAVRSSATAEDLPDASFAGQQETLLNVPVNTKAILIAIKKVVASLFGDRAISYREEQGYPHDQVALCACVQQMVRSDKAVAGVMFSVDSETGHSGVVGITAVWGLGELAVGGANTDEYIMGKPLKKNGPTPILYRRLGNQHHKMIFESSGKGQGGHFTKLIPTTTAERSRFCLSQSELDQLTNFALTIENHYGCPMDMEWAKDGLTGKLFIVQARPITVNKDASHVIETCRLAEGKHTKLISGLAVGSQIASGPVRILKSAALEELNKVKKGDIIVARMTDPNYLPAMRLAAAIITEEGSSKCHAAIIARELKKAAIVACRGIMTKVKENQIVTVCCAEGLNGHVYEGAIPFTVKKTVIGHLPELKVALKMNVGDPSLALSSAMLPNRGVGLARQEFIINNAIGIHPRACLDYPKLSAKLKKEIDQKIIGFKNPVEFYVRRLAEGIALITRAFAPYRVVIRLSDFKTNEYCDLLGGNLYEPKEENPMLGFRGAARYSDKDFQACFALECEALSIVRKEMGLTNFDIMVPFVRTVEEGKKVKALLSDHGLVSIAGKDGMMIGMMCELPSNVFLAEEFTKVFDFASIGSNDLTQLVLGADRDSGYNFGDERNEAVKEAISLAIKAWRKAKKPIGICGQAPSDHKGYAEWLMEQGITSMSLNVDSVIPVWQRLVKASE